MLKLRKSIKGKNMKKRLFSIVAIATLATNAWADISTEQLNTYLKASGTDVVLEKMQKQMAAGIEMKAKMRGQEVPADILKAITTIASSKENVEKFTKGLKSLDEKDYKEIVKFYDTKIGQKKADIARNTNALMMQQEIEKFSKKALPKERKNLISQFVNVTMSEKKMEKMAKVMMDATLKAMPKEMQAMIKEKMDAQMTQMKPMMKEQAEKGAAYMYRDYSDAELKLLIDHYKTPSAQKETDAVIDGSTEYMGAVMSQMMEVMKKKRDEGKK